MPTVTDLAREAGGARALARRLGYHHAYIARIVRGDKAPSGAVLRRIKDRMGVVVDPDAAPRRT